MEQEGIVLYRRVLEIPDFFLQKRIILRVDFQFCIKRNIHLFCGSLPKINLRGIELGCVYQSGEAVWGLLL